MELMYIKNEMIEKIVKAGVTEYSIINDNTCKLYKICNDDIGKGVFPIGSENNYNKFQYISLNSNGKIVTTLYKFNNKDIQEDFDINGNVLKISSYHNDELQSITTQKYDEKNRCISKCIIETDGNFFEKCQITYNDNTKTAISQTSNSRIKYDLDDLGRIIHSIKRDISLEGGNYETWIEYDEFNNIISRIDSNGRIEKNEYNDKGLLTKCIINNTTFKISYEY